MTSYDPLDMLTTEKINPGTEEIDTWDTEQVLQCINQLDQEVPMKVAQAIPQITAAVEYILERFNRGGRLVYVGAGTSGRIGNMDAVECPPTYGIERDRISALIAGGKDALVNANEGIEDSAERAANDLKEFGLKERDVVLVIASSGRTPYCVGALKYATAIGAGTISLACNLLAVISRHAQVAIEVDTGPEAIMGSTRMKGGTAQKLVLNMISTSIMIRTGKVYRNLMVNIQGTNEKLHKRVKHIVKLATGLQDEAAVDELLLRADDNPKVAITMALGKVDAAQALEALREHDGYVRRALGSLSVES
ncbi:N-acetylmuramic acid 6-phosphate etherase [Paenibacillus sp. N3.4]|uniref:N-acetylmuramic acid 6-phosphate etherase n=1 Tax=Paenibacillus sp. N3.4 TaxID=2603222 RepID=UPI0021C4343C|nr:N-acetylmuramic acid 6-phosphate etherase [Paenibacillus sp. N3.4]